VLYRLSEKGVGAICLQKASTEFTQKGCEGQTLGAVRSTGIFLYENGTAGTIQQVDVAKYDYSA
jgi:glutamate synthase domain-containing protein 3